MQVDINHAQPCFDRPKGDCFPRGAKLDEIAEGACTPRSCKSNSPFRYPGGKFYARRLILGLVPEHTYYCEPFAGGASIFFAKEKAKLSILNDLDAEVINTLMQIRDNVEDLIELGLQDF